MKYGISKPEHEWSHYSYAEFEIALAIGALNKLLDIQEESIKVIHDDLKEKIKVLENLETEEHFSSYNHYSDEEEFLEELLRWHKFSIFLSAFSFFEGKLKEICNIIESENNFKIKLKDLRNNEDLLYYMTFLTKVYGMENKTIEELFKRFRVHKKIKNIITHHNGIFTENEKNEIPKVKGLAFINFGENYNLIITDVSYLRTLIEKIDLFFVELLILIDKRFSELKKG